MAYSETSPVTWTLHDAEVSLSSTSSGSIAQGSWELSYDRSERLITVYATGSAKGGAIYEDIGDGMKGYNCDTVLWRGGGVDTVLSSSRQQIYQWLFPITKEHETLTSRPSGWFVFRASTGKSSTPYVEVASTGFSVTVTYTATASGGGTTYYYTVDFDANASGVTGVPSSQNLSSTSASQNFTIPNTTPSRSGYDFDGWTLDGGTTLYQPGRTVSLSTNRDHTFTASWSLSEYTCYLRYNANGGSGAPTTQSHTGTSTSNHTFTISNTKPTRQGYLFLGWATSLGASTASYQPGGTISVGYNSSVTLYAVWKKVTVWIKTTSGWKLSDHVYVKTGASTWKEADDVYVKTGTSTWKD